MTIFQYSDQDTEAFQPKYSPRIFYSISMNIFKKFQKDTYLTLFYTFSNNWRQRIELFSNVEFIEQAIDKTSILDHHKDTEFLT